MEIRCTLLSYNRKAILVINFCAICHEEIKNFWLASEYWQDICEDYLKNGCYFAYPLTGQCGLTPILRHLEQSGFIVSTECDIDGLSVKPVGITDEKEDTFYVCKKGDQPHDAGM